MLDETWRIGGVPWRADYPNPFSDEGRRLIERYWKRQTAIMDYRDHLVLNPRKKVRR